MFHVGCLKAWLKRKNACPICQRTDVATPGYELVVTATKNEPDNNNNNNGNSPAVAHDHDHNKHANTDQHNG
jgi:hypothetical protein